MKRQLTSEMAQEVSRQTNTKSKMRSRVLIKRDLRDVRERTVQCGAAQQAPAQIHPMDFCLELQNSVHKYLPYCRQAYELM